MHVQFVMMDVLLFSPWMVLNSYKFQFYGASWIEPANQVYQIMWSLSSHIGICTFWIHNSREHRVLQENPWLHAWIITLVVHWLLRYYSGSSLSRTSETRTPLYIIIRTLFLKFQLHREVLKDTSLFSRDTLHGFNGVHSREVNSTVNLTVHVHNYIQCCMYT